MSLTFTGGVTLQQGQFTGTITPVPPPTVNAVNFDGTNDYLTRGADYTDNVNGSFGTVCFWLKKAADGGFTNFVNGGSDQEIFIFNNGSGDKIKMQVKNTGNSTLLVIESTDTIKIADGWVILMMSWDLVADVAYMYIGDIDVTNITTNTGTTIDYTQTEHSIGASIIGEQKFNGDMAEVYINFVEFIDFSVEVNRRKFIDSNGKPVDLGSDGSTPTGNDPIVYLTGDTSTWHTNAGTGGSLTVNGELTTASTSPSD